MNIFCAGVSTETNTFSPIATSLKDFEVVRGATLTQPEGMVSGVALALKASINASGHNPIISLIAFAQPAGKTIRQAYEIMRDEILSDLRRLEKLPDIVFLPLHGAMVAEGYDDCEGDLISKVRDIVGSEVVIGVLLDPHCHMTKKMIEHSDIIVTYKEYPHTDVLERAQEVLKLSIMAKDKLVSPQICVHDCDMIGNFPTTSPEMRAFVDAMKREELSDNGILSLSLCHGFSWGDVDDMGTKMLTVIDANNKTIDGQAIAKSWSRQFVSIREKVESRFLTVQEAMTEAFSSKETPVVIADQADNPGGGGPGDSTYALKWIIDNQKSNAGIAILWDPNAVSIAHEAGVGSKIDLAIGGHSGDMAGSPVAVSVEVVGIKSSHQQFFPQDGGHESIPANMGNTAALKTDNNVYILVCDIRCQNFSYEIFNDFGIDPLSLGVIVVKSSQHFYASYSKIASKVLFMDSPATVKQDLTKIKYTKAKTHRYPFL